MNNNKTVVSVRGDRATGIATTSYGANQDVLAFNINLIARVRPRAATELLRLYEELKDVTDSDADAPQEDFDSVFKR